MSPHHHLHESTLMSYAAGALPVPLSIVAGTHLERCPVCRQRLREAEAIGSALLEHTQPALAEDRRDALREAMLAHLSSQAVSAAAEPSSPREVPHERSEADPDYLPASLHPYFGRSLAALRWRWIAPGVHCIRAEQMPSLIMLKIAPGKCLPMHSHGQSELTQILRGSYNDALGLFAPGDVADLDEDVEHQPVTAPGVPCICVSALDAPLVFSGWLARRIQRFVKL
ncbi:TPA: cupin domain-containing protein [Stenotrophomonas maltophilia]|uniref:ChrR family anti-sigma-E factor n=1 Tax=Stenotrophomonas maltophilia TaxID=40324 RepID=UPI0013DB80BA|nr:ChrR family anti-sigma-E factor [Stenotrophomonas maltophilia]MBH1591142.1 cupin domain-containing protein [Stenotrophomonas maltophilia]HEL3749611.1 cupin domain-containing protein [Stenotrophomonas maltophilia]HEL7728102.1 cupin domain-containing protein [Stenotrophomonas maltophilia]